MIEKEMQRSSIDLRSIFSHRLTKDQINAIAEDIDPMGQFRNREYKDDKSSSEAEESEESQYDDETSTDKQSLQN